MSIVQLKKENVQGWEHVSSLHKILQLCKDSSSFLTCPHTLCIVKVCGHAVKIGFLGPIICLKFCNTTTNLPVNMGPNVMVCQHTLCVPAIFHCSYWKEFYGMSAYFAHCQSMRTCQSMLICCKIRFRGNKEVYPVQKLLFLIICSSFATMRFRYHN